MQYKNVIHWHRVQLGINQRGINDLYHYYKHTTLTKEEFMNLFAKDYFFGDRIKCMKTYFWIIEKN